MIIDHRTYNITPRRMKEYLEIFETYALPIQIKHLGAPLGFYVVDTGPLDQVVHLWAYDSMADMEVKRSARNADPDWAIYMEKTKGLIVSQETKIIRPAPFSPTR